MSLLDRAEGERLAEAIGRITPALEQFNSFEGQDLAALNRATWLAALDEPLPQQGVGLDAVLQILAESVIPYGLRIGSPGFSGWVTIAPSTAGTAATLAATVAGAQRSAMWRLVSRAVRVSENMVAISRGERRMYSALGRRSSAASSRVV